MSLISECFAPDLETPDFTTGRSWILRLGLYRLQQPKVQADDWVWIIDHLTQIGQESCFFITGIRLRDLPPPGVCLTVEDLEPIGILPVTKSTGEIVHQQLEAHVPKTGVPRVILADRCNDLQNGLRRFGAAHTGTAMLYDVAHKAACLLHARLERNPQWKTFCSKVGQTKYQTQQTELAILVPPTQRSKARYMNLEALLTWANRALAVVDYQPPEIMRYCTAARLEEKFGWLRDYRDDLAKWSEYQAVAQEAVHFTRCHGFYRGANVDLARQLRPVIRTDAGEVLADEFITFVAEQSAQAHEHERGEGRYKDVKRVGRVITAIGKKAGVKVNAKGKPASAHDLRRSFGQQLADAGVPARDLQAIMRHSRLETTEKYYLQHNAAEQAKRLADRLIGYAVEDRTQDSEEAESTEVV